MDRKFSSYILADLSMFTLKTLFFFGAFIAMISYGQEMVPRKVQLLTLDTNTLTCSRNMACKYAVCLWEREPTITEEKCTFLDNNCVCPNGNICALTNHVIPSAMFVTFQYRCRDPAHLFSRRT